jgi:hypothetical protein
MKSEVKVKKRFITDHPFVDGYLAVQAELHTSAYRRWHIKRPTAIPLAKDIQAT